MSKFYMIPNSKNIELFKESIILPLEDYSNGFDVYFNYEEIESIAKKREVSVMINSFLHSKELDSIIEIIKLMPSVKYFFVEDLGLLNIIDRDRIVIFQNHIINNYKAIQYYNKERINNIVISNELTLDEILMIKENTDSNLFYFLINRNILMYSKRKLISSYFNYKDRNNFDKKYNIIEKISKRKLIIKEEKNSTVILNGDVFSGNFAIKELANINFIINFNNLSDEEFHIIMNNYKSDNLSDYISVDNYFLKNKIIYKVGDMK